MVEVKMPSEIRAYKSKLIMGLSTRQFISLAATVVTIVPLGIFGHKHLGDEITFWLVILLGSPIVAFGFFTFRDMKFEDFAKAFISMYFLPQRRVYEDTEENIYCSFSEEIIASDILQQRIDNGEYDNFEGSE